MYRLYIAMHHKNDIININQVNAQGHNTCGDVTPTVM